MAINELYNSRAYTECYAMNDGISGCRLYSIVHDRRVVLNLDYETKGIHAEELPAMMENYAQEAGADKICVRVPGHIAPNFIAQGYQVEASVPEYYGTLEPMLFLARYLTARRALASKVRHETGHHLEIRYRSGSAGPDLTANLQVEEIGSEKNKIVLDFYMEHNSLVNWQDLELVMARKPQVIFIRQDDEINGVGAMFHENEGRAVRVQGLVTPNSDENMARALVSNLWRLADRQGASCLYSLTSTLDDVINRALPAAGFSFRGKLGADTISDGVYGDRYVWSRNL